MRRWKPSKERSPPLKEERWASRINTPKGWRAKGIGGQRIFLEGPLEGEGSHHNGQDHADQVGEQRLHALLEFLEDVGDGVQNLVIDAHGNHHGSAADTGNQVGKPDDDAAEDIHDRAEDTLHFKVRSLQ